VAVRRFPRHSADWMGTNSGRTGWPASRWSPQWLPRTRPRTPFRLNAIQNQTYSHRCMSLKSRRSRQKLPRYKLQLRIVPYLLCFCTCARSRRALSHIRRVLGMESEFRKQQHQISNGIDLVDSTAMYAETHFQAYLSSRRQRIQPSGHFHRIQIEPRGYWQRT